MRFAYALPLFCGFLYKTAQGQGQLFSPPLNVFGNFASTDDRHR